MLDRVELHVPLEEGTLRGPELREAVLRIPGVRSVGDMSRSDVAAHARVLVEFDADITNPILIREELGRKGFIVSFAGEVGN